MQIVQKCRKMSQTVQQIVAKCKQKHAETTYTERYNQVAGTPERLLGIRLKPYQEGEILWDFPSK